MTLSLGRRTAWIFVAGVNFWAPVTGAAEEAAPSWADTVKISGDLRLRYEMIREDDAAARNRARYRGRVGLAADLAPNIRAVFGLATGGDDPVSTNETFGDGFSTKSIGVDLAFVEWAFHSDWTLLGGKMKQPWTRVGGTTLVWDSDLNPEGLALAYKHQNFFGSAGSFIVQERSDQPESRLNTFQAGIDLPMSGANSLLLVLGYFDYTNTIGNPPFYNNDPQGNTVDGNGNYVYDYNEIEFGAQYVMKAGNWPLTFFGDYLLNTETSPEEDAYTVGVIVGKASKPGSMQFGYSWHYTEADALNATYNDSDLADGQTNAKGHYFRARYQLRENIYFNGSFIFSEFGGSSANAIGFDRIMLDIQFEF